MTLLRPERMGRGGIFDLSLQKNYLISIEDRDERGFTTQRCNFFLYTRHFPSRIFTFHRQHSQYIGSRSGNPAACFQLLFVGLTDICFRTDTQPIPHNTPCRKRFQKPYGRGHCFKLTGDHYIIKRQPARQNIVEKYRKVRVQKKVSGLLTLWSGKRDSNPRLRRGDAPFHILPGPPKEGDSGPRVRVQSGRSRYKKRSVSY